MSQPPANDPYPAQPSTYPAPGRLEQPPPPQPPGFGYPPPHHAPRYPEASQATLAFVFGILGIVWIPPLAPFAWWLGGKDKRAIDAGLRDPAHRGLALAGYVLGIIGTVLLALAILAVIAYVLFFALAFVGAIAGSSWTGGAALLDLAG